MLIKPLKKAANCLNTCFWTILELIFPAKCLKCNQIIERSALFCNEHWQKLQFITEPKCQICSHPFEISTHNIICANCLKEKPYFDQLYTIFRYNSTIKKILLDLKYYDATYLGQKLGQLLLQKFDYIFAQYDFIIAVPLHKKRLYQRKYNQASLLIFTILKKHRHLKFYPNLLKRHKYIKSQANLSKSRRQSNLKNSFTLNKKYQEIIKGKNVLIVDDVYTTGATANNCAKVLKNAGCTKIDVLCISKAVLLN